MKCEEGNKLDLVEYLFSLGFTPTKIRSDNYWYISPLRDEKEASFKIDRNKNVWYDHGAGKGGTVVDFVTSYFNCDVSKALQKLSSYQQVPQKRFLSTETPDSVILPEVHQQELFNQNNNIVNSKQSNQQRPPFHLHENSLINHKDAAETAIEIIAAKKPITDPMLCRYLKQRRIDKNVANKYCDEVIFKFSNKAAKYTAIGFKNTAGGFELRSESFKLSSSPKYVTYITNDNQNCSTKTDATSGHFNASNKLTNEYKNDNENLYTLASILSQNEAAKSSLISDLKNKIEDQNQTIKQSKSVAVFEGFFDFLTYQTVHQNQTQPLTDFLILNSLAFFERSLLLMEKHEHIHLYLDHDEAGKNCLDIALKRSSKYKDESSLYEGYKDLNNWVMYFGKLEHKQSLKQSSKMGLP
jgi:hypothetical protein